MKVIIFLFSLSTVFLLSDSLPTTGIQGDEDDINLVFYSIDNPKDGIVTNVSKPEDVTKTSFSAEKNTVICIHGWHNEVTSSHCQTIKDIYLEKHDINVFILDWDKIAADWIYPIPAAKVEEVGNILGGMLQNFVKSSGLDLGKTSIVGHSLGAHIAGVAGDAVNGELEHVVGLDPAGPLFWDDITYNRISPSSGKFVQVIHTCGIFVGFFDPIGHADYYVNGGKIQPMCDGDLFQQMSCSHQMVLAYYKESLLTGNFKATKCNNSDDFESGKCDNGEISLMGGYNVDKKANGTYFLDTNYQSPYAKN